MRLDHCQTVISNLAAQSAGIVREALLNFKQLAAADRNKRLSSLLLQVTPKIRQVVDGVGTVDVATSLSNQLNVI